MSSDQVLIREVVLRDGLQLVADFIPTWLKCRWIGEAAECGFDEMEVTSFVPPQFQAQFSDAEQVVAHAKRAIKRTCVLAPNLKAVHRALEAKADKINFVISGSESFNRANLRRSIADSLAELRQANALATRCEGAHIAAVVSTAFICPFEGPVPARSVHSIIQSIHALGISEVVVADTTGHAHPKAVTELLKLIARDLPQLRLGVHFHDTLGLAMANAFAALEQGVRMFDTALAGLGGCPNSPGASGNLATEDLAFALERTGMRTGLDVPKLLTLAESVANHCAGAPRHSHLLGLGRQGALSESPAHA